jgi:hypothetical protein
MFMKKPHESTAEVVYAPLLKGHRNRRGRPPKTDDVIHFFQWEAAQKTKASSCGIHIRKRPWRRG